MKGFIVLIIATIFLLIIGFLNYITIHKRADRMIENYEELKKEQKEFLKKDEEKEQ